MSQLDQNTTNLQNILETVNSLPSGGGGVQPDWNQTDETAADFIKNKPFGRMECVVVPLGEYTLALIEGEVGTSFQTETSLAEGDTFVVNWEGEYYTCVIVNQYGMLMFGNYSAIMGGEGTGEPFAGMLSGTTLNIVDLNATETVTRTLSITATYNKKIESAYISHAMELYLYEDENGVKRLSNTYSSPPVLTTYAELLSALANNIPLLIKPSPTYLASYVGAEIGGTSDNPCFIVFVQEYSRLTNQSTVTPYYTAEYSPT